MQVSTHSLVSMAGSRGRNTNSAISKHRPLNPLAPQNWRWRSQNLEISEKTWKKTNIVIKTDFSEPEIPVL